MKITVLKMFLIIATVFVYFYCNTAAKKQTKTNKTEPKQTQTQKTEPESSKVKLLLQKGHTNSVNGIRLTQDESKLISYSMDNTIKVWDMQNGKLLHSLEGHTNSINGIQLTKDESKLFSFDHKTIKIWDAKSGKLLHSLEGHTDSIRVIQLTKDESKLISLDHKTIKILDAKSGKLLHSLEGHTGYIFGTLLTKDESKLISYSNDNTIKVWDVKNGKLLYDRKVDELESLASDGGFLIEGWFSLYLISYYHQTIQLWDVKNGKSLGFVTTNHYIKGIQLTKDESKLISYGDETIEIRDIQSGKLLHSLEGHTDRINGIQLTKDGSKLISYSWDNTIKVWDIQSGKLLHSLDTHSNGIQLTKDESKLISFYYKTITVWDWKSGKLLHSLGFYAYTIEENQLTKDESKLISYFNDNTIKIWDAKSGKLLHSLEGHTDRINGIQLTKDESKLISYSNDKTIKVWDIQSDKLLHSLEGHTDRINGIQLTKDESKLISYSNDKTYGKTIEIWDMQTGKLIGYFDFFEYQLTNDESKLISYYNDNTPINVIKVWDIKNGKLLHSLEGHTDYINKIQLTQDGSKLISYSNDKTIKVWDIQSGKLLHSLEGHTDRINGIQLTKDESKLISYSWDNTIKVWDIQSGKLLHSLDTHSSGIQLTKDESKLISFYYKTITVWDIKNGKLLHSLEGHTDRVDGILLTKDETKLISFYNETYGKTIKIWDMQTDKLLQSFTEGDTEHIKKIQLTQDESKLISYSDDNTIKIWDMQNGERLYYLSSYKYQLTQDESKLIFYSDDNTIKIWDMQTGKLLKNLVGHSSSITNIRLLKNETLLLSSSNDGTTKYWDISDKNKDQTIKPLASIVFTDNNSSLVYTPDGYFDYKGKEALNLISYMSDDIQSNFIDLQDLMNDYHVDGLLELILYGSFKPNTKNNLSKGVETSAMVKSLFDSQKIIETDSGTYTLRFTISEKGSKLEHADMFVNGILVETKTFQESDSVQLEDNSKENFFEYKVKFDVPLNYGNNRVELKVYNEYKVPQSYPSFELIRKVPQDTNVAKPDLYIVSIGINEYQKNKLKYSVADAESITKILSDKKELYTNIYSKVLTNAKKKEIEDEFTNLETKVRPQDVVVIYMSGHGMNAFTREGKKLFYYVPQDFKWPEDPENENVARMQGIDADYLNDTFTKVKSHKLILILDACHSGSVNVALASRSADQDYVTKRAMEKMANGTGRFVFASSSGNELSREHDDIKHGIYTHVLLNALKKGDQNKDGLVYLSELRFYIEQNWEDETKKYLRGVVQTPPAMSLGRNSMHERVNDFPLIQR
jgi:WD40 repeat protein